MARNTDNHSDSQADDSCTAGSPAAWARQSFSSAGWDYSKIEEHENISVVELHNRAQGVRYKESVKWQEGGYEVAAAYEIALPLSEQRARAIERWLRRISDCQAGFGIDSAAACIPFDEALGQHVLPVHIGFNGRSQLRGTTRLNAEFSLGGTLKGRFHVGALHDSGKFTADLTHTPVFMARDGCAGPAAKPKVFSLGRGRFGTQAALSFLRDGKLCGEGLDLSGRLAPPLAAVPVRLEFPGGTLAVPMDDDDRQTLQWLEDNLTAIVRDAPAIAEIASYVSAENKYLCVRHLLQQAGAGVLCILGVIAGGGAAVGTGGITIGAFLLLASICMGAQAVVILDMILAHKGFA